MKKLTSREAEKILTDYLVQNHPEFVKHPEFRAIISHFLQTPNVHPPFMSKEIYDGSLDLLRDYMTWIPTSRNHSNVGS